MIHDFVLEIHAWQMFGEGNICSHFFIPFLINFDRRSDIDILSVNDISWVLLPFLGVRLPHSSLFWPRKGQTLDNYIRECDLKTRTDVEKVNTLFSFICRKSTKTPSDLFFKENAHFYFSEAIISAIEQIKFTQQCNKYFGQSWSSSSITSLCSPCETIHASSSNSSSSPPTQQYIPCNSKLITNNESKVWECLVSLWSFRRVRTCSRIQRWKYHSMIQIRK